MFVASSDLSNIMTVILVCFVAINDTAQINAAIADWEQYTCLDFRPAADSDVNYIHIKNGEG